MADTGTGGMDVDERKVVDFSRKSDFTLVSSDGVRFRVNSTMMSEASDVFDDMFNVPQPVTSGEEKSATLSENAQTLNLLLSWIYPNN